MPRSPTRRSSSPHGHVPASLLADDDPFGDPASLLITPDHYVLRLLHAAGVPLDSLGRGPAEASGRSIWRTLCEHWDLFLGTPVRYWFESELADVFGVTVAPSASSADELYDQLSAALAEPSFRPRALFDRFRIEVLATTDDPADDLDAHRVLRDDATFSGRVVPTFRADRYMDPSEATWASQLEALSAASGIDTGTHAGLLAALRSRRAFFASLGGTATDTGVLDTFCEPLPDARCRTHPPRRARRSRVALRRRRVPPIDALPPRRDGGRRRARHAAASGGDPQPPRADPRRVRPGHRPRPAGRRRVSRVPLTPILRDFGTASTFRLVLFTVDETTFSREIAPLAGFYPAVYAGAPWWFLDAPAAIRRYREAVTETIGFTRTSGFIDDTRAFCSIPARHDMSRRVDAGYLASLVARHQLTEDDALGVARALVDTIPRTTFRL